MIITQNESKNNKAEIRVYMATRFQDSKFKKWLGDKVANISNNKFGMYTNIYPSGRLRIENNKTVR